MIVLFAYSLTSCCLFKFTIFSLIFRGVCCLFSSFLMCFVCRYVCLTCLRCSLTSYLCLHYCFTLYNRFCIKIWDYNIRVTEAMKKKKRTFNVDICILITSCVCCFFVLICRVFLVYISHCIIPMFMLNMYIVFVEFRF